MKVRYTLPAAAELAEVLDYITERSPQGASKVKARVRAVERMLSLFPETGQQHPTKLWQRKITIQPYPYVMFYEVTPSEVIVHRIRHSARNPADA